MKLVWCPDTALKAYMDAVHSLSGHGDIDIAMAELVAAMAGGWKAQVVVEAYTQGDESSAICLALASALKHTCGRRVVIAPDTIEEEEREVLEDTEGVDFMVVDMRSRDAGRVVREARVGPRGMVVVCQNVGEKRKNGGMLVVGEGMRVVRSAYLPIGRGVEILHVGVGQGPRLGGGGCRRWFKHVDLVTGEEHLFRK